MLIRLTDVEVFQTQTVERMNEKSFLQYLKVVAATECGCSSNEITTGLPAFFQVSVDICWNTCRGIFADIHQRMLQSKTYSIGRQLIETPNRLARSKGFQHQIAIDDIKLSRKEMDVLVCISYSWYDLY